MKNKINMFMCPKCCSKKCIKNGHIFGWQRYKCKECKYQFTKPSPKGKPLHLHMSVHLLYVFGLSMRNIAKTVGLSAQSVSRWIRKWHQAFVFEVGTGETFFKTSRDELSERLGISEKAKILVSSRTLSSGAKIHVLVQLPDYENH